MKVKDKSKKTRGSSIKDKHGETCMCKRCRARDTALERKNVKPILNKYYEYLSDD